MVESYERRYTPQVWFKSDEKYMAWVVVSYEKYMAWVVAS